MSSFLRSSFFQGSDFSTEKVSIFISIFISIVVYYPLHRFFVIGNSSILSRVVIRLDAPTTLKVLAVRLNWKLRDISSWSSGVRYCLRLLRSEYLFSVMITVRVSRSIARRPRLSCVAHKRCRMSWDLLIHVICRRNRLSVLLPIPLKGKSVRP